MRDDLHHSLPLNHRWRRVVQAFCAPGRGKDRVDEMTRAVWEPADQLLNKTEWGRGFQSVLSMTSETR